MFNLGPNSKGILDTSLWIRRRLWIKWVVHQNVVENHVSQRFEQNKRCLWAGGRPSVASLCALSAHWEGSPGWQSTLQQSCACFHGVFAHSSETSFSYSLNCVVCHSGVLSFTYFVNWSLDTPLSAWAHSWSPRAPWEPGFQHCSLFCRCSIYCLSQPSGYFFQTTLTLWSLERGFRRGRAGLSQDTHQLGTEPGYRTWNHSEGQTVNKNTRRRGALVKTWKISREVFWV